MYIFVQGSIDQLDVNLLLSSGLIDRVITILTKWLLIVFGKNPSPQYNGHCAGPTFTR